MFSYNQSCNTLELKIVPTKQTKSSVFLRFVLFIIAIVSISTIISLIPQKVSAAPLGNHPVDYSVKATLYNAFRQCVKKEQKNQINGAAFEISWISASEATNGNWWHESGDIWGYATYRSPSFLSKSVETDGRLTCNKILSQGLSAWGISSPMDLLCGANIKRTNGGSCQNNKDGDFDIGDDDDGPLSTFIQKVAFEDKVPALKGEHRYLIYEKAFYAGCGAVKANTGVDNRNYTGISIFNRDTKKIEVTRFEANDKGHKVWVYTTNSLDEVNMSCGDISKKVSEYSSDYKSWDKSHPDAEPPVNDGDNPDASENENPTSCDIEGTGWIICPIANTIAKATDSLYGWVSNFLVVQPLNVNTAGTDNTMYNAWKNMRNIANVAFVVAFLIIIFSQLTGAGVSNYGVKKMIPRLIISAILVNISYWVAAIAVDISNVVGNNIYNVLRGTGVGSITLEFNVFEQLFVWLLSGGAIAAAGFAGVAIFTSGLPVFLPVLLWGGLVVLLIAALALLVAFLILALRQALIIILIVLSPLAFVAFLLPNTEKFFNMWRKSLMTLLIFYPLFSVLFGGSYLAGMIIIGSAGGASGDAAVGLLPIMGLAVMTAPLALTPLIIKFSSGVMGTVAGMVNNKSKGLIDRSKNIRNRKAGLAMNETLGSQKNAKNPFGRVYRKSQNNKRVDASRQRMIDGSNNSAFTDALLDEGSGLALKASGVAGVSGQSMVMASAFAAKTKEDSDEISAEKLLYTNKATSNGDLLKVMSNSSSTVAQRAAAAGIISERGSDQDIHKALNYLGSGGGGKAAGESSNDAAKAMQQQMASDLGGRKPVALGAGDMSSLKTGEYSGSLATKAASRISDGKISADSLTSASKDELNAMQQSMYAVAASGDAQALENIDKLRKDINKKLTGPNAQRPTPEATRAIKELFDATTGASAAQTYEKL